MEAHGKNGDVGSTSVRGSHADTPTAGRDEVAAIRSVTAGWVPFHGAAVEHQGRVVVLAGVSGAGKSTLAAGAVLAGWGFIADEVAAVSPSDRYVHPYHRPIGIRRAGAAALGLPFPSGVTVPGDAVDVDAASIGRLAEGGDLHTIAVVSWEPEAQPQMELIEPAQAMVELLQHLVAGDEHIAQCFAGVNELVRSTTIVRLTYDTPANGVGLLDDIVGR